jgi:hypothetical protein
VGYIVRSGSDLYAATKGSAPIWENRKSMREVIAQHVEAEMALFDVPGYLAEILIEANELATSTEEPQ